MAEASPKRFTAPVNGPTSLVEDPDGNLVYYSEYEALVQAFAIYMREGMDSAQDVLKVLEPHLGADAAFVAALLAEADDDDVVVGKGGKS